MEALLSALGSFGTLAAESISAGEARRAQIRSELDANYHAFKSQLEGFWAGLKADDAEMAALAKPLPVAAPAPVSQPAPVDTPPVVVPQPSGVE